MNLFDSKLPIVAPLLKSSTVYSNYHEHVDINGYFKSSPGYNIILNQNVKGFICVDVVHCTYFIRFEYLQKMTYDDGSYRYEYVIFSDNARKLNIGQFIDNRYDYGRISLAITEKEFINEPWYSLFNRKKH